MLFAWRATTNAPRVGLDLSQSSVERVIRPASYAGHRLERMALRVDRETIGGVLPDVPHRTAEQVRQPPNSASLFRDDNHIHLGLTSLDSWRRVHLVQEGVFAHDRFLDQSLARQKRWPRRGAFTGGKGSRFLCRGTPASLRRRPSARIRRRHLRRLQRVRPKLGTWRPELTTSSDHWVSCSRRMMETSTVTPSLFTVRESPEWMMLGSRSIIAASAFVPVLCDGARVF
jgi:hypothetical protein